jgi:hypothetical protein
MCFGYMNGCCCDACLDHSEAKARADEHITHRSADALYAWRKERASPAPERALVARSGDGSGLPRGERTPAEGGSKETGCDTPQ